ncbi:hypothetical protein M378DRAFT_105323 [Amanita muscaria Koide BX008]|uniref:Major facilitator superfamily (MFS) profile domain-containing protein n=1 Tax=Amanita muscaria (strain Koide BX008) TaxID=946122 RepID=A0A0C2SQ17_AMAMK|nr:hypothetical protein M378DRAFT_105323 [Amanita muscaria Koide BX008]
MIREKDYDTKLDGVLAQVVSDHDSGSFNFAGESGLPPPPELTPEQERRLWRKIDIRLLPMLGLMYLMSYLDRGNIANARIDGLETQLGLTGNQFNTALTVWFVPYCVFECAANLVLKKFRPSKWLPGITVAWGLVAVTMGLVKNYEQLITVRFFLGLTEAGLFPGMAYYLTIWYPRDKLQSRVGIFFGSATLAGAFSGLFAYWIGFMSGVGGRLGWAWIFIIEGAATILVGLVAFLVLVDFPATARFLTPEERSFVIHKQKMEYSNVGEEEHFEFRHIWAAITDWQLWAHVLIFWSIGTPLYGIAFFLPTIINSFGYTVSVSQLLTIPPYLVATILIYVWGYLSEKRKIRSPFLFASLAFSLIGLAINISDVSDGVKYFGTYWIVAGAAAAFPGIIAWLGNNLAGQYKRGTGMAIQLGLGNISGTFASNIYRNQDAPKFIFSHSIMIMFTGVGFITVAVTTYVYKIINRRRERTLREMLDRGEKLKPEEIRKLGDKSPTFRYMI